MHIYHPQIGQDGQDLRCTYTTIMSRYWPWKIVSFDVPTVSIPRSELCVQVIVFIVQGGTDGDIKFRSVALILNSKTSTNYGSTVAHPIDTSRSKTIVTQKYSVCTTIKCSSHPQCASSAISCASVCQYSTRTSTSSVFRYHKCISGCKSECK